LDTPSICGIGSVNHARLFVGLLFLAICVSVPAALCAEDEDGVRIAVLSPHNGASLNASSLHVQALVASYQDVRNSTFIFNGQQVPGRNSGRIGEVDAALDGKVVDKLDTRCWGAQLITDFRLDISRLPAGPHTVTVTAYSDRKDTPAAASVAFTLDPSLVAPDVNRIEDAATPQPFGGFSIRGDDGNCGEGGDHDSDWPPRPAKEFNGQFVLGHLSDGIDISKDRVIISLGSEVQAIEPGKLQCKPRDDDGQVCRFEDRAAPLMQNVEFSHAAGLLWNFKLQSGQVRTADTFTSVLETTGEASISRPASGWRVCIPCSIRAGAPKPLSDRPAGRCKPPMHPESRFACRSLPARWLATRRSP
jgi:hypothetical protein